MSFSLVLDDFPTCVMFCFLQMRNNQNESDAFRLFSLFFFLLPHHQPATTAVFQQKKEAQKRSNPPRTSTNRAHIFISFSSVSFFFVAFRTVWPRHNDANEQQRHKERERERAASLLVWFSTNRIRARSWCVSSFGSGFAVGDGRTTSIYIYTIYV